MIMHQTATPLCVVVDNFKPVPYRDGSEDMYPNTVSQLVAILRSFVPEKPRELILGDPGEPDGTTIFVGIGGGLAGVDVYPRPSKWRSWRAKPKASYSTEEVWFVSEGESNSFDADSLMPPEDAIRIVAYIVVHKELPDWVDWIDAHGNRIRMLREATWLGE